MVERKRKKGRTTERERKIERGRKKGVKKYTERENGRKKRMIERGRKEVIKSLRKKVKYFDDFDK
jgi:hypothetical protein